MARAEPAAPTDEPRRRPRRNPTGDLDVALREALAEIRADSPGDGGTQRALDLLRVALTRANGAPQAVACAQAAAEHLLYGELPEARTLLTAARGVLASG
ncbi:hypothetical protein Lesp02_72290 [Lentzea sp. NBRC 105346]|uniref:hypothetical protein n=1 Tax=Lentzea sp. NBRC 105346 TaxID=3032205 RepID=UPI0024A5ADE1|nr:hypothetical protein [Lentzea sp. NBRC 105346]GLZ35042.1 hypothetical protein Lesp02_72290 [Lentzea sp. NBRC 105346]